MSKTMTMTTMKIVGKLVLVLVCCCLKQLASGSSVTATISNNKRHAQTMAQTMLRRQQSQRGKRIQGGAGALAKQLGTYQQLVPGRLGLTARINSLHVSAEKKEEEDWDVEISHNMKERVKRRRRRRRMRRRMMNGMMGMRTNAPSASPTMITPVGSVAMRIGNVLDDNGFDRNMLNETDSYQQCALNRVEEVIGVDNLPDSKVMQYYTLYCIYCATNGVPNIVTEAQEYGDDVPGWNTIEGWDTNDSDPCATEEISGIAEDVFHGITCVDGLVEEIELFSNILTGNWPPECRLFAAGGPAAGNLNRIDLYDNNLLFNNFDNTAWIPLLGDNMEYLFFGSTSFFGPNTQLPANLREYDNSYTLIDGPLSGLGVPDSITYMVLDGNFYRSPIPIEWGGLPNLENLYIGDGSVSGTLDFLKTPLPNLFECWLDLNPDLTGPIPPEIGLFPALESFSVTDCALAGPIPGQIGDLPAITQMWFFGNQLNETIPPQIGMLQTLQIFQVEDNDLIGSMPDEVCMNTPPSGILDTLGADCETGNAEVVCPCCSCCSRLECGS